MKISFPVLLRTHENDIDLPVRLCNMSARGIAVRTGDDLSAGSRIEVTLLVPYEISLTKSIAVRISGQVVRVQPVQDQDDCDIACTFELPLGQA
jgi:hypothetical protein